MEKVRETLASVHETMLEEATQSPVRAPYAQHPVAAVLGVASNNTIATIVDNGVVGARQSDV